MTASKELTAVVILTICVFYTWNVSAEWSSDVSANTAISTAARNQYRPQIISDGVGGAIITWVDGRKINGDSDIYAQRIDANGVVQWTANGVAICTASGNQDYPNIISDGEGGAIITWSDRRSGSDIYAQRIDVSGVIQWVANGVAICIASGDQNFPKIISDWAGGAIITWEDTRNDINGAIRDIYAQRIDAKGMVQWATDGVTICAAAGNQYTPAIISDRIGGAIITWEDRRIADNTRVYAQRINANGMAQWETDGVTICAAQYSRNFPTLTGDGNGGAIITWQDWRSGWQYDIYAQRINASGVVQWTDNGVAICTAIGHEQFPSIVSNGNGGAIITWSDTRTGFEKFDIYAQSINASGAVQWEDNGVAICTVENSQAASPTSISDSNGGAIIAWAEVGDIDFTDIYAQRINSDGVVQWAENGAAISTASGAQYYPTIATDSLGGAIITWQDRRNDSSPYDIYAQLINAVGTYVALAKGDVNIDGHVDPGDAILGLQILSGLVPNNINPVVDVDGDRKIGMAEVIYAIKTTAGL